MSRRGRSSSLRERMLELRTPHIRRTAAARQEFAQAVRIARIRHFGDARQARHVPPPGHRQAPRTAVAPSGRLGVGAHRPPSASLAQPMNSYGTAMTSWTALRRDCHFLTHSSSDHARDSGRLLSGRPERQPSVEVASVSKRNDDGTSIRSGARTGSSSFA